MKLKLNFELTPQFIKALFAGLALLAATGIGFYVSF